MNIQDMPAGRELDVLVAEKVMGWHKLCISYCPESDWTHWASNDREIIAGIDWSPSTSIACAWEVVEKLTKIAGYGFDLNWVDDHYLVGFEFFTSPSNIYYPATSPDAPLAICRAALMAVGGDE